MLAKKVSKTNTKIQETQAGFADFYSQVECVQLLALAIVSDLSVVMVVERAEKSVVVVVEAGEKIKQRDKEIFRRFQRISTEWVFFCVGERK